MGVFEPVLVPEDFDRVTGLMDPGLAKPTVARLRSITRDVLTARYWKWVLLHPELPDDMIHASRRVFAPTLPTQPSPSLWCPGTQLGVPRGKGGTMVGERVSRQGGGGGAPAPLPSQSGRPLPPTPASPPSQEPWARCPP